MPLTTSHIAIIGMTCKSCVHAIETRVKSEPGIQSVKVNLSSNDAFVEFDSSLIEDWQIVGWIDEIGFEPSLIESKTASTDSTATPYLIPPPSSSSSLSSNVVSTGTDSFLGDLLSVSQSVSQSVSTATPSTTTLQPANIGSTPTASSKDTGNQYVATFTVDGMVDSVSMALMVSIPKRVSVDKAIFFSLF
jgi:copper chaperone CopZ